MKTIIKRQIPPKKDKEYTLDFVKGVWEIYDANSVHYFKTEDELNAYFITHRFTEKT